MTIQFLVDEDLDEAVVAGLRRREPRIDVLDVKEAGLRGLPDPQLLEIGFEQSRVLVSCDRATMTKYFSDRIAGGKSSAGLCIIPQGPNIGKLIDELLLLWGASTAEEWRDQVLFL